MKGFIDYLKNKERGFTLIEILVVVAILGMLSAVAVPNVGSFITKGRIESYNAELHNLQTGVMAMLHESHNGTLDAAYNGISDMDDVQADGGTLILSAYMAGLNADGTVKTRCTYKISQDGGVILQSTP